MHIQCTKTHCKGKGVHKPRILPNCIIMAASDDIKTKIISLGTIRDDEIYCTEIRNKMLKFYGFNIINYHDLSAILSEHSVTAHITLCAVQAQQRIIITVLLNPDDSVKFPQVLQASDLLNAPFEYSTESPPVCSGSSLMHSYKISSQGLLSQILDSILAHPHTLRIFITCTSLQILVVLDRQIRDGLAESIEKLRRSTGAPWKRRRSATAATNRWNARLLSNSTAHAKTTKSSCGKSSSRNCHSSIRTTAQQRSHISSV